MLARAVNLQLIIKATKRTVTQIGGLKKAAFLIRRELPSLVHFVSELVHNEQSILAHPESSFSLYTFPVQLFFLLKMRTFYYNI